jgi:putative transposase
MGIEALYPKPKLSRSDKEHAKYPYLLKGVEIERINQVWGTDITYIPTRRGYVLWWPHLSRPKREENKVKAFRD